MNWERLVFELLSARDADSFLRILFRYVGWMLLVVTVLGIVGLLFAPAGDHRMPRAEPFFPSGESTLFREPARPPQR